MPKLAYMILKWNLYKPHGPPRQALSPHKLDKTRHQVPKRILRTPLGSRRLEIGISYP
jgi:hypothetical protein